MKIEAKKRTICHSRMTFAVLGKDINNTVYFLKDKNNVNGETPVYEFPYQGRTTPYIELGCLRRQSFQTLQTKFPEIYEKEIETIYNSIYNI
jgi:hypothetical protein